MYTVSSARGESVVSSERRREHGFVLFDLAHEGQIKVLLTDASRQTTDQTRVDHGLNLERGALRRVTLDGVLHVGELFRRQSVRSGDDALHFVSRRHALLLEAENNLWQLTQPTILSHGLDKVAGDGRELRALAKLLHPVSYTHLTLPTTPYV